MREATETKAAGGKKAARPWANDAERLRMFGEELDRIRDRVEAEIGADDLAYIKKVNRFSRAMEAAGRALIHFSIEPVGFFAGVTALWLHKQLQATEVGHTALHGAFDKIEGSTFQSKTFAWDTPIDEESWRHVHNVRHHQYTNIAGKDPDIHFGPMRLNEHTPYDEKLHGVQLPFAFFLAANFGLLVNFQYTGLNDLVFGNGRGGFDIIEKRDAAQWKTSLRRLLRGYVPYYFKNYVFFPALAGPFFWKVMLGNFLAELMTNLYSAATIYCGHVGEDVADYAPETKARGRGQWYAMQIQATNNYEVPLPVSILCGALDRQIEHHLFPRFPTNRLREIAPEVRALCEKYEIEYKTDTWGRTLKKVLRRIRQLSQPTEGEAVTAAA